MKHLMNEELTNSTIFNDYDQVIEPAITDLFCKLLSGIFNPEDQPDIEIYDMTDSFPLSDPENEQIFVIKLPINPLSDAHMIIYEDLCLISSQDRLSDEINNNLDSSGDYALMLETIWNTNCDIYFLFSYCK